jgi:hypothetical protein
MRRLAGRPRAWQEPYVTRCESSLLRARQFTAERWTPDTLQRKRSNSGVRQSEMTGGRSGSTGAGLVFTATVNQSGNQAHPGFLGLRDREGHTRLDLCSRIDLVERRHQPLYVMR